MTNRMRIRVPESGMTGASTRIFPKERFVTRATRTAIAVFALALAVGATAAEPVSRPLADAPGAAKAALKNQPRTPAPTVNVLSASLDAQGRVVVRCGESENPAFRAWRESLARRGVQER